MRIIGILLAGLLLAPSACSRPAGPTIPLLHAMASRPEAIVPAPEATIPAPVPMHNASLSHAAPAFASEIPEPGLNEVWLWGNEYKPDLLTVPVGTTVTWVGKDSESHDVESDIPGLFHASLAPGDTFQYTFDTPGIFGYRCLCGLIFGTIVVQ